ncbi:MAG: hypothetical protein BIFFINMI_03873 [Phycisphaerae bacterium]|nr:hypothetical protein [Phycisphaerae bacterium]
MKSRRDRIWNGVDYTFWVVAAVLFHVAVLLIAYYWPAPTPPQPTPILRVAMTEGNNPYLKRERPGPADVPAPRADQPRESPAEPQPEPPQPDAPLPNPEPAPQTVPPPLPPDNLNAPQMPPDTPTSVTPAPSPPTEVATNGPPEPSAVAVATGQAGLVSDASPKVVYGSRFGDAREAARKRFGGRPGSVEAVGHALDWLAAHQDADGMWDRVGFEKHCPAGDKCGNAAIRRLDRNADVGITGLALLAFLGDGHLPGDPNDRYRGNVRRAIDWLVARQQANGQLGATDNAVELNPNDPVDPLKEKEPLLMYNHAIGTIALAEAYSLTREPKLAAVVRDAVAFLEKTQQPEGGWDYYPAVTHRNDTSITGWAVMALKAAATSGVRVSPFTVYRAAQHVSRATETDGSVWYADRGTGVELNNAGQPTYRYGPAMIGVGVACRQFLGYRRSDAGTVAGAGLMLRELPNVGRWRDLEASSLHTPYYWYQGSLGMFQMGGQFWARWSAAMQDVLLRTQDSTLRPDGWPTHRFGSWQAYSVDRWGANWGAVGGRVYMTAMNALTLEIFYRYLPLYEQPAEFDYGPVVESILRNGQPADKLAVVDWLACLRPQLSEPLLYRLLKVADPTVRYHAAISLTTYGSPLGRGEIERQRGTVSPYDRVTGELALGRIGNLQPPDEIGRLVGVDVRHGLARFTTERASYIGFGLPLAAYDASGAMVARMLVVTIHGADGVAVAELSAEDKAAWASLSAGQIVKLYRK